MVTSAPIWNVDTKVLVFFGVLSAFISSAGAQTFDANAVLAHSKATYAGVHAYADSGTVVSVTGSPGVPPDIENYSFVTAFVTPRRFIFDSHKKSSGERLVVWANAGDFNSWWSATRTHEDYPQGQGAQAFATASYPTAGAVLQIASLLFPNAGLQSSLAAFSDPKPGGVEAVNGHLCYKLVGRIALAYGTGTVAGARKAVIWIDKSSFLIRRLFEDTPEDAGPGVSTTTTTFDPQLNPNIDSRRFQFAVPAQ